ncbi:MAG: Hsp20/alpha crystallin family protein [Candidatus Hadarchaeum sp.]|uniref:Hsp20/alpha crystallin family protein n=1 Tax=Candidatus Hadarchaeum sp. TaxID=2883567 RepID=UPI0031729069
MVKRPLVAPEVCAHYHSGKKYEIHVRLREVKKENIELNFSKNGFCIKAQRDDLVFATCRSLDVPVDPNKVKTKYYDVEGLLEIVAPLLKPIKTKRIPIR